MTVACWICRRLTPRCDAAFTGAIVYLDARTAELVGQDGDLLVQNHDVKPPSNLNDSELFPSMRRLPESRPIPTEMLYVQFRATLATHIRAVAGTHGAGSFFKKLASPAIPIAEKLEIIHKLENSGITRRYSSDVTQGVPLQLFTMNAVQTFLTKMRLVAQGRTTSYNAKIFELSMALMNLQMELWVDPCLQRWLWHSKSQFQWFALTCLIRQTRLRETGTLTLKAVVLDSQGVRCYHPNAGSRTDEEPSSRGHSRSLGNRYPGTEQPDGETMDRRRKATGASNN